MDERVRTLNALQYMLTAYTSEVRCKKSRKFSVHEKDEKAYWIVMDLVRRMRRELKNDTLDF